MYQDEGLTLRRPMRNRPCSGGLGGVEDRARLGIDFHTGDPLKFETWVREITYPVILSPCDHKANKNRRL